MRTQVDSSCPQIGILTQCFPATATGCHDIFPWQQTILCTLRAHQNITSSQSRRRDRKPLSKVLTLLQGLTTCLQVDQGLLKSWPLHNRCLTFLGTLLSQSYPHCVVHAVTAYNPYTLANWLLTLHGELRGWSFWECWQRSIAIVGYHCACGSG